MSSSATTHGSGLLADRRVLVLGRLASMPRREVERLIRAHGGALVERGGERADLVVVSDEAGELAQIAADRSTLDDTLRQAWEQGELELVRESDFWARMGLIDASDGIEGLYTPALMAGLVRAPISAIRHWYRRGALRAKREVRRLPYFDFEEVGVARKLAQLLAAGCSLGVIDRRLQVLARLRPMVPRPLADPAVVVEGRSLRVRREDGIAEPSGQLLLDFDAASTPPAADSATATIAIPIAAGAALRSADDASVDRPTTDALRSLAAELEQEGRSDRAIDVYRAILISGDSTADDHFALAELLYRRADLSAARERYYVAIELDEDFVEARSNLGCVLAEQAEWELAEAAFRGALEYHPHYADGHYHLARLLERLGRIDEARRHWEQFLELAPASPWADEARERVATDERAAEQQSGRTAER